MKQVYPFSPSEFDGGDAFKKTTRTIVMRLMSMDAEEVKVIIMSCNPFVTDFLRGLVEAHGYDTAVVSDFSDALVQVQNGLAHIVFIDDACLDIGNFKNFQLGTQNLIQEGVPIILLADEQTKQEVERQPKMKFFRIVRKPLGYQQIGQVMADLLNV